MALSNFHRKPLNIAHRGARSLAPENTLAAARKALEVGADMWELDVGISADGELVVIHDLTLERTSDVKRVYADRKPWRVCDFSLRELKSLDFGSWFVREDPFGQIAVGNLAEKEYGKYMGEPILTLQEALEFTLQHRWQVNVEIKDLTGTQGDFNVVEQTIHLIEDLGAEAYVILSSFNPAYLKRASKANPNIPTALLTDFPQMNLIALLGELKAQGYHPRIDDMQSVDVRFLQLQGYDVRVWVVNDEETMNAMIERGVNAIFTDFPQLLKAALDELP
ncbi:MAG: glycerophosphodiester phosphodiesterase family protein [Desulfoferrobacter sp.]